MGYVYVITNTINGKQYVGKTTRSIKTRFYEHIGTSKKDSRRIYLYNAIRKYGASAFSIEEVFHSKNEEKLFLVERMTIVDLNCRCPNGYNMTDGGEGVSGLLVPDCRKKEISKQFKNLWKNQEYRQSMLNRMRSEEFRLNASIKNSAIQNDPKTKEKNRATQIVAQNRKDVVEKKRIAALISQNTEEVKKKKRDSQTRAMADPKIRAKLIASVNTEEAKKKKTESMALYDSKPDTKMKRSLAAKKAANRPETQLKLRRKKTKVYSNKGKTYEEIYGVERASELRLKRRKERKGKTFDEVYGKEQAIEIREKLKIAWRNRKTRSESNSDTSL